MNNQNCVSVVIPTNNRPDILAKVLESYLVQPECGEVIIVDDGSDPANAVQYDALAQGELGRSRGSSAERLGAITLVRHANRQGAAAARNTGLRRARHRFIMTTDDDICIEDGYMSGCLSVFTEFQDAGYVGGRVVYLDEEESNEQARRRILAQNRQRPRGYVDLATLTLCFWGTCPGPTRVPFCSAVGIWDRRVFEQGVSYDEQYRGNAYREESDPQLAAQIKGFSVIYQPDAFAYHLPPSQVNARRAGQHRGGRLWYEYWALRNNLRFLRKYGSFLHSQWRVRPFQAAIQFEWMRVKQGVGKVWNLVGWDHCPVRHSSSSGRDNGPNLHDSQ